MKKVLSICLIILLITGCKNVVEVETGKKDKSSKKILVVYYSRPGDNYNVGKIEVGNTKMVANYIIDYLKADSFEIEPTTPYPDDYETTTDIAKKEQQENARPNIKNKLNNINDYDTIFLGYPIWWGDMPMIVYTFIENYDLSGKTVIPFNTHEGSGSAGTYEKLKTKLNKSTVNTDGLALEGKVSRTNSGKKETLKWLKKLGY